MLQLAVSPPSECVSNCKSDLVPGINLESARGKSLSEIQTGRSSPQSRLPTGVRVARGLASNYVISAVEPGVSIIKVSDYAQTFRHFRRVQTENTKRSLYMVSLQKSDFQVTSIPAKLVFSFFVVVNFYVLSSNSPTEESSVRILRTGLGYKLYFKTLKAIALRQKCQRQNILN